MMKESVFRNERSFGDRLDDVTKMEVDSFPYNCIGAIYSKRNRRREFVGTGFLISSDLVLTVAHNIYTHESKER